MKRGTERVEKATTDFAHESSQTGVNVLSNVHDDLEECTYEQPRTLQRTATKEDVGP